MTETTERTGMLRTLGFAVSRLSDRPAAVIVACTCIVLQVASNLFIPWVNRHLLDVAVPTRDLNLVLVLLGAMTGALVLRLGVAILQSRTVADLAATAGTGVRAALLHWVHTLEGDRAKHYDEADLTNRITVDVVAVEQVLVTLLPRFAFLSLNIVACVGLMFWLDWRLALVTVVALLVVLNLPRAMAGPAALASAERKAAEGEVLTATRESLALRGLVLSFGLRRWRDAAVGGRFDDLRERARRAAFTGSMVQDLTVVAFGIVKIAMLGLGAILVVQGSLSVGSLFAFLLLVNSVSASAFGLSSIVPSLIESGTGVARVRSLLDDSAPADDGVVVGPLAQGLALDDVTFGYTPGQAILDGLSLTVGAGTSVAFVGPSGSGKSTVLKMLTRTLDPQGGRVTWDGVSLADASRASLRTHTGIVAQDSRLFDASIQENIRTGRLDATDAEVEQAAREAELHDLVVAMPGGYLTRVGPEGRNLSGGQRQRVSIARALLRNPSLLVLDEATSALDSRTEHAINRTLERLRGGRTVVSVTHRLAASRSCDTIFVLDEGLLVEQGTHDALLAQDGLYASLWTVQAGIEESNADGIAKVEPSALALLPLFQGVDAAVLSGLADRFVTVHVREGESVFRKGDFADALYLNVRGRLTVEVPDEGGVRVLRTVGAGDFFGELGLLHDVRRTATVRASTDTVLLALFRSSFERLVARDSEVRDRVAAAAAARAPSVGLPESVPPVRPGQ
ncbi:MAG: ATP-binding cassette domain-containing protein [Deltaproteobacteria bacterium]|nr:ATP-binding cassette domain-containing protein [Deltaproteobacteria bacterium]